ncbi:MAG: cytochrome C peroxidase, partial [Bacteroidota bacterium]
FQEAFPDMAGRPAINPHSVNTAIAAYVASLRGFDSPFDQYVRGEKEEINPAVVRGFNLFMGKAACGTCHFAPGFQGLVPPLYHESETEVLGVPKEAQCEVAEIDPDLGRYANGQPKNFVDFYKHSFKTSTVRNVALTAPYMHNGVYTSLEEVMEFYNNGGGAGLGIDLAYQTLAPDSLGLNQGEISDLILFMESLTDTTNMTTRPAKLPSFPDSQAWNQRIYQK